MMYLAFGLFLLSYSITASLIPFIIKICGKFSIVDFQDFRKQKEPSKVRLGGLSIVLGSFIPLIFSNIFFKGFIPSDPLISLFIFGSLAFFIIGFLDDIFTISPLLRLFFQISFSTFIWSKGIRIENISFAFFPSLNLSFQNFEILSLLITVFWIVAIVNAINWLDGLDSLAIGVSSIVFLTLLINFWLNNQLLYSSYTLLIFGSCFGFLCYNLPPAKILMGDGGSYFLGFNLAIMTLFSNTASFNNNFFLVDRSLLFLFIPLFDMSIVIFSRLKNKRSPFYPDRSHLHHRLLDSGISYKRTLFIIFLLTTLFILIGVLI